MHDTSIILPSKLKVIEDSETKGIYDIEGLYPGYGHTLGNSLRRIVLSSIPGSAITSVKIEGADHEFMALDGAKEDVIAILLNLKKVRFNLLSEEPQTVTINVQGPAVVSAADIQTTGEIEVMNKDQYIAEITDKKAAFKAEITVERGLGFVPRTMARKDKMEIGAISVDAIFTPVRKVSYSVENMRVGDRTDFNRLRLQIDTDGSVAPHDALAYSIKVIVDQLRAVVDLQEIASAVSEDPATIAADIQQEIADSSPEQGEDQNADYTDVLKTRIDSLDLSTRTLNALENANIRTLGGLVRKSEEGLMELDGIGKKGVDEIREALGSYGLDLKE